MAEAMSEENRFLSHFPLAWSTVLCYHSDKMHRNNLPRPQPGASWWSGWLCSQTWSRRIGRGPPRLDWWHHRWGFWGPILGFFGTGSHKCHIQRCCCFQSWWWRPSGPGTRTWRTAESAQPGPRILEGGETVRERAMHRELGDLGMGLGFTVTSCVTLGMTFSLSGPELPQL
jgi:hypothetical protein